MTWVWFAAGVLVGWSLAMLALLIAGAAGRKVPARPIRASMVDDRGRRWETRDE